jgi:NAD(P)-dependent dehydrogenase (short-subunit alcohol dehydrogenase family)
MFFYPRGCSKVSDIQKAIEKTAQTFGHLDIVFANAGIHDGKDLFDMTESDWDKVIDINLKGVVFTVKETLPYLIESGEGAVILTGSDQCFVGKLSSCAYGISKGGIGQFTKSAVIQLGKYNIRVNGVCPATIQTPLAAKLFVQLAQEQARNMTMEELWSEEASNYPLKRIGTPENVEDLVYFLASDQASFITGSLYLIDGGLTAN